MTNDAWFERWKRDAEYTLSEDHPGEEVRTLCERIIRLVAEIEEYQFREDRPLGAFSNED